MSVTITRLRKPYRHLKRNSRIQRKGIIMKYTTTNEFEHFSFSGSYIGDIQITSGFFHLVLDNVIILPENSCNRDIRDMRTNELLFKIENMSVESMVEEGYRLYDANGKLIGTYEDITVEEADYPEKAKEFVGGSIYSLEKQENTYIFTIDAANERTYILRVSGTADAEEWDRFLNIE